MNKKISGMILREDIEFFEQSGGLLSRGYMRQQKVLDRAEENLRLFAQGNLDVNPRDYADFAKYINTFAEEEDKEKLFDRLKSVHGFDAKASLKEQNMSDWQYAKTHYAQIINLPQQKATAKKAFFHISSFMKRTWQNSKVAILTAAVIIGGAFGMKNDSHSHTLMPKENIKVKNITPKTFETPKSVSFQELQSSIQTSKYNKLRRNFYSTKLEILTSATQRDAMCNKVEAQINKGIFKLPASISKEQVAYVDAMYKAYGLASPVANAINAEQKLSQEQQEQLIKDLQVKDSEIKNKALAVHGRLGNHSSFKKAGHNLQKKHITNLKQLRDFKQKSAAK